MMTLRNYIESLQLTHTAPSAEQLHEFQEKHLALYSFSSINALKAEILPLDEAALLERVVLKQQGGYCFELNKLAYLALHQLGYEVTPLLARVLLNGREDNGRTHRLTLVHLADESYLCDVGFGSKSPQRPLPVSKSGVVEAGHYRYKITRDNHSLRIDVLHPESVSLYSAELSQVNEMDCDIAHFYSHQHPESNFVKNLILSRVANGKRYTIRNLQFSELDERSQLRSQTIITSPQQLLELIRNIFLINLSTAQAEHLFSRAQANAC